MKPEHRLNSYVVSATVTVMYLTITQVLPYIQRLIPHTWVGDPYVAAVLALLGTAGIYKLLATALGGMAKKWIFLKRHLLGPYYVGGTWVGNFEAHGGAKIYSVEYFEQTLTSLKIWGHGFTEDGKDYATWTSQAASINPEECTIYYMYDYKLANTTTHSHGVAVFTIQRDHESSPPNGLDGHSADLPNGIWSHNRETKISDYKVEMSGALQLAKGLSADGA